MNGSDPGFYPDPDEPGVQRWWDGTGWTSRFRRTSAEPPRGPPPASVAAPVATPVAVPVAVPRPVSAVIPPELRGPHSELEELRREYTRLKAEVLDLRDMALLQEVGLYQYTHPLDSSAQYKDALATLGQQIKAAIKAGQAVTGTRRWAINGSEKDGLKMVSDFGKLMLRAYNSEADNAVRTLRPYSLAPSVERLEGLRQSISKLGASMKLEITAHYHGLRVKELELTADYLARLAEEKEAERDRRARLKEEAAAQRELEAEQARLEKEKAHYEAALAALRAKGDAVGVATMEAKLGEIGEALSGVLSREANIRAGYVYVISNVGAFGPGVVKIGMTRRLDPLDRVRELGDASVPFRFDVHAIVFSDDAVGLEGALHRTFAARRVNFVNAHREFFNVAPSEVKRALLGLQGSLLSFVDDAEALEWHQSETIRRALVGG